MNITPHYTIGVNPITIPFTGHPHEIPISADAHAQSTTVRALIPPLWVDSTNQPLNRAGFGSQPSVNWDRETKARLLGTVPIMVTYTRYGNKCTKRYLQYGECSIVLYWKQQIVMGFNRLKINPYAARS